MATQLNPAGRLFDGLRHPLLLLVIGSVIGSFLIPWITERASKKQVLQEARLRKAVEIVENNQRTVSQLSALVTRLQMFHKDNRRLQPSPTKLIELQEKLASDMNDRYLEFDKEGWWWYRSLTEEASILEILPPEGAGKLREHVEAYATNILQTVNALNELWAACIAADYKYQGDQVNSIESRVNSKLQELSGARNQLVTNLVRDFKAQP